MANEWETVQVNGADMGAYVSEPDGAGPYPGVVVIMEAFGVVPHIEDVARRFSAEGFVAIAPDLYHKQGPRLTCGYDQLDSAIKWGRNLRDEELITDVGATVDYLKAKGNVKDGGVGIVGYCVGGRISYLTAGSNKSIGAAAVYYGGNIMNPFGDPPTPFERTSSIQAPVLGLFGEEDKNPSPDDVGKIEAELKRHGATCDFHIYPNAGHGFFCEQRASYAPEAAKDAWEKTLAWFNQYL